MAEHWHADRGQWVRACLDTLSRMVDAASRGRSEQADLVGELRELTRELLPGQARVIRGHVERALLPGHLQRPVLQALATAEGRPPGHALRVGGLVVDVRAREGLVAWLASPLLGRAVAQAPQVAERSLGALTRVLRDSLASLVGARSRLEDTEVEQLVRSVQVLLPSMAVPLVDGPSLDLAVALHLWTRIAAIARTRRILVMGRLDASGAVLGVGALDDKVMAALDEAPELDALVVPLDNLDQVRGLVAQRRGTIQLTGVRTFDDAVNSLGMLSVWPELALMAEEAEASQDAGRKRRVAAMLSHRLEALPPDAPDPTWAPAVLWQSRLLPHAEGAALLGARFAQAIEALEPAGPPLPADGTSPEDLAELASDRILDALMSLEWDRGWAVIEDLARLPGARVLWPELWPGTPPVSTSPELTWLRRRVAVGTSRLYGALGHHHLQLDQLEPARALLEGALPDAPAAERGRLLLHLVRVELRSHDLRAAMADLSRVSHESILPAARASRLVDRTEANAEIVSYRATTLALHLEGGRPPAFSPCHLPEGLALHRHDLVVRDLAEVGRAWVCGDAGAWRHAFGNLEDQRRDSPLLNMLVDALQVLGPLAVPGLSAGRGTVDRLLASYGPVLTCHSALEDVGAVANDPRRLWRLPHLDPLSLPVSV